MTTLDALAMALMGLFLLCVLLDVLGAMVAGAWFIELLWSWLWSWSACTSLPPPGAILAGLSSASA